jgi:hypothetical protein
MNEETAGPFRAVLHGPLDGGCGHWAPFVRPAIGATDQSVAPVGGSTRPAIRSDSGVSEVLRGEQAVGDFRPVEDLP